MRVGQRGKITQIVVGCDEREDKGVKLRARVLTHPTGDVENLVSGQDWAKSAAGSAGGVEFSRLFAPSIPQAKAFPWYNKPWSFKYFLMHGNINTLINTINKGARTMHPALPTCTRVGDCVCARACAL